ncbi:MAG: quinonprotein alcohol dehydrogenase [Micavibrio sp.]|nr:quinonprotein alcohol dehydrogenase [Micavibrio sp.]|tara:strand:+ start:1783 stop:3420 length:1638 start_codon:yes stop_codon:yes gene_type:complete
MLNVTIPSAQQKLSDIINQDGIVRDSEQAIVSPNGQKQKWLIDLRPILLNVEALEIITNLFWDQYQDKLPFQIAGMEVAAVPLVTALLMKARERGLKTNGLVIRKERKTSGLGKSIEGVITDNPIILVDDIMNSGASLEKAFAAIEQEGYKVEQVFVIINYKTNRGEQWQKQKGIQINELFDLTPFDVSYSNNVKPFQYKYSILWRFYQKGAFPFAVVPKSTPLLVRDKFYMGSDCGKMFCINAKNGQEVWSFDVNTHHPKGIWSSPAYHKGRIYFGAYNGILYCLDAMTGLELWKNSCCEFIGSSPLIVPEHDMLYIGLEHQRPRMMGSNAAFDLKTGERKWEIGQKKYQHGSAAYYKEIDAVIFGNADHDVSAYEAKTGKLIWKNETDRSIKYPPTIDEKRGQVIATSFDGNIYILDAKTGERKAAIQTNDICYTTALVTHDKIFAGSGDRHLYIIDANTLELIEKRDCYAKVYSSPRLIDGNVIFGTSGGKIMEMNPDTLEFIGNAQLPDAVTNAVSANEDTSILYASTHMNELYAIERKAL